jgi:hypothetical protein
VGNPAPFPGTETEPWGSSRPGPNLYSDALVKLDEKTGKVEWYHQVTPHALYDWDFQNPPILVNAGGKELVVGAASPASSSRSTPRPASRSGNARSASTTATTTTACWRCAANTHSCKRLSKSTPATWRRDRADVDRRLARLRSGGQPPVTLASAAKSKKPARSTPANSSRST